MRIGLIAPPWVPVPPVRYGGTEQVVHDLAMGLRDLGHDVRLFSVAESTCPALHGWYFDRAVEDMGTTLPELAHVVAAYEDLRDVDVVHDHTLAGALLGARLPGAPPVVVTQHNAFTDEARLVFREIARTAAVVAISHSQRSSAPEIPVSAVIHHGIDQERHAFGDGQGDFLLFLGRMSPDKGLHRAIHVARAAGRRLVAVSKMRSDVERDYFASAVQPLLGEDVELLPELSAPERIALLRSAAAVLNPIRWREPFGLVMAEALACGTPVLAFPCGAAPEIIDDGVTGFLCEDEADMVRALARLDTIDRRDCRAAAEQRFSIARMATDHERLYRQLIARSTSAATIARPREGDGPLSDPWRSKDAEPGTFASGLPGSRGLH